MLKIKDKWIWDFWLVQDKSAYHIFYLQASKSLIDETKRHHNATIGHAVSTDLINWDILPDALSPSREISWDDLATWTGSVIKKDNTWYMFYTGVNKKEKGLIQRIGVATSAYLIHWEKHHRNPLIEADNRWYELLDLKSWHDQAWRDPFVFPYNDKFYAFITARVNYGPADGRGVIACAESSNLIDWKVKAPISEPGEFGQLEVPQVVKSNNSHFLVFSTAVETTSLQRQNRSETKLMTGTFYLIGDNILGPYRFNGDEVIIGDSEGSLYSGKIVKISEEEILMMAFHNYTEEGDFLGYISNPFEVSLCQK
jgi:beta-fructofuranosidase